MSDTVKIVECPRDAWQALPAQIPARAKADYLHKLIAAGFRHIDAVSFVSPAAVPQMADSENVLQLLEHDPNVDPHVDPNVDPNLELIGIVVNRKGAERAIATGAVQTLGFPFSISPQFLRRNQNQSPEESFGALNEIVALSAQAGLGVVAYLSMAFGNPYGEPWNLDLVSDACQLLIELGVRQISLADTVGLASGSRIAETVAIALGLDAGVEIGVHLHARREQSAEKIRAAYQAGCRRFDAAMGGMGGCPFAQDALVGNISTEILIAALRELGAHIPRLQPLDELMQAAAEIDRGFSVAMS
jgi:hydroxymethylglutaryl-CoA lyase